VKLAITEAPYLHELEAQGLEAERLGRAPVLPDQHPPGRAFFNARTRPATLTMQILVRVAGRRPHEVALCYSAGGGLQPVDHRAVGISDVEQAST